MSLKSAGSGIITSRQDWACSHDCGGDSNAERFLLRPRSSLHLDSFGRRIDDGGDVDAVAAGETIWTTIRIAHVPVNRSDDLATGDRTSPSEVGEGREFGNHGGGYRRLLSSVYADAIIIPLSASIPHSSSETGTSEVRAGEPRGPTRTTTCNDPVNLEIFNLNLARQ